MIERFPVSARVIRDYTAHYPDALSGKAGEVLTRGRRDEEWPGWMWCKAANGKEGWTPEAWLDVQGERAVLLRDYDAQELSVQAGELVWLLAHEAGWFWARAEGGKEGWLPGDSLEILPANG